MDICILESLHCSPESVTALLIGYAAESLQSCPTLCDPVDSSPPGSPIPGILQARTLEWVAISSPMCENEVTQLYLTLSDPMDCSLPGSSIHGIRQARVLKSISALFFIYCAKTTICLTLYFAVNEISTLSISTGMEEKL